MHGVSRRGLFSLVGGLGGLILSNSKPSLAGTLTPNAREELRRTPMDDDAEVFETFGKFDWFNLDGRYGFLAEIGSERRILVHVSCLNVAGIKKIPTDAVFHCQVLRRTEGWQAFRILDVIRSAA